MIKSLTWNRYVKTASVESNDVQINFLFKRLQVLKRMGVQNLFNRKGNFCDLYEGAAKYDECLLDTVIKHRAKFEINESGSKASAVTLIYSKLSMPFHFNCNRPFVFIIHDAKFEGILFAGVYRGPN